MPAAEFVPLADIVLRGASAAAIGDSACAAPPENAVRAQAPLPAAVPDAGGAAHAEPHHAARSDGGDIRAALRDARLFRARLADAFDDALSRLVREVATAVLARELHLAPCDLAAIVARIARAAPVTCVRVSDTDAERIRAGAHGGTAAPADDGDVRFIADASLADGDAIVELAHGAVDARFGVRLSVALEAFA